MQRVKQGHQATGSWHFCSSVTRGGHRQAEGGGGGGRTARARAEAGQHGGEGDGGAEDGGDREDGAVHHGHLGHEEHRLDERDDQAQSVLRQGGAQCQRAGRAGMGKQRAPLRRAPATD